MRYPDFFFIKLYTYGLYRLRVQGADFFQTIIFPKSRNENTYFSVTAGLELTTIKYKSGTHIDCSVCRTGG